MDEGQVRQDPFVALEECSKVVEDMKARLETQANHIHDLEAAIKKTNEFIIGGKTK
jgi:hypothetical protein